MIRKYFKTIFFLPILIITSCAKEEGSIIINPPGTEFKTQYRTMQLVGDFNGWALEDLASTKMELISDWSWQRIQYFSGTRDSIMFKFVPNSNWELAFGTEGSDTGLSGYAEPNCPGTGNHITAGPINRPGYWKFTFNEQTLHYSVAFYSSPGGAIKGTIGFSDVFSSPYPLTTISVFDDGNKIAETTSDTMTSQYIISPLPNGAYTLLFEASGYIPDTVKDVNVHNDTTTVNVVLQKAQGIIIDGNLSDWDEIAVYDTIGDSPWGSGGDIGSLYTIIQNDTLFIGIEAQINNNALIIYMNVEPSDSSLGYTDMDAIDFYPRKFIFPDSIKPQYIIAQWVDGNVSPEFRSIDTTGITTNLTDSTIIASSLEPGIKGALEIGIPISLISITQHGRIGLVALIAGGDHYDGPESVPENDLSGDGSGAEIQNLYFIDF